MQHEFVWDDGSGLVHIFQYPRTDRTGCNSAPSRRSWTPWFSFSILGRIERDATCSSGPDIIIIQTLSVSSDGSNGMQPHPMEFDRGRLLWLSVSSDGSNGMQPAWFHSDIKLINPFSILGRIERDATCRSSG